MFVADNWKDYEVIDTSCGEKLERWGDYILVRPDPQVIWDTPKNDNRWKHMNGHYHRSSKGGGEWEFFDLPQSWTIKYESPSVDVPLTFNLKPFSFKHTGIFPEQAANWDWFSEIIKKAKDNEPDRQIKVLNLFAYTGGATLACAAAGAHVTHVDASKGIIAWAKENATSSGLIDKPIRWIVDDCVKFVEREIRRGNHYDAIIMDPPSYGRGPKGEIWKIGYSTIGNGWKKHSMLPEKYIGKEAGEIRLMLPIQIRDVINEYTFIFKVYYTYDHPELLKNEKL